MQKKKRKPRTLTQDPAEVSWKQLYSACKGRARRSRREFSLTLEQYKKLGSQNCYYDNAIPKETRQIYNKKRYESGFQKYNFNEERAIKYVIKVNGIDRIDPKKGYVIENCVPCCGRCNEMKMDSTEQGFYEDITRIFNFKIKGKQI